MRVSVHAGQAIVAFRQGTDKPGAVEHPCRIQMLLVLGRLVEFGQRIAHGPEFIGRIAVAVGAEHTLDLGRGEPRPAIFEVLCHLRGDVQRLLVAEVMVCVEKSRHELVDGVVGHAHAAPAAGLAFQSIEGGGGEGGQVSVLFQRVWHLPSSVTR